MKYTFRERVKGFKLMLFIHYAVIRARILRFIRRQTTEAR